MKLIRSRSQTPDKAKDDATPPSPPNGVAAPDFEGPGKGKLFFDRARTVAESGNHEYAIDMFIEGLNREPQNIAEHQALHDVALRRKVKGGKPAGGMFGAKGPLKGKTPKDQMLNAEYLLAKDPGNLTHMLNLIRAAAAAGYVNVIRWFGPLVTVANKNKPKKEIYLELATIYEGIGEFVHAAEAVQSAIELDPTDMDLIARVKDLAARQTIKAGRFETADSFKESIRDVEATKKLLEEENLSQSEDYRVKNLRQAEADYEKNPTEHQLIAKYANALRAMDNEEHESKAIEVYRKALEATKTYRYKFEMGDVRMKQLARNVRKLSDAYKLSPSDKALAAQLQQAAKERLAYELEEYKERVDNNPTELNYVYEYGRRLYHAHRFDEAIHCFQLAQNNPRHRADALHLLGRAFMEQNMKPEAIEVLKRAIDEYELADAGDAKGKEFHYWLARAYEETGHPQEAIAVYSRITQWDIAFRDTRKRLEALRKGAA